MKRYICSSTALEFKEGFLFNAGNKDFFLESNSANITDKIARKFINALCDLRNVGDALRETSLYDPATLKDVKRRIEKATLEHKDTGKVTYWTITMCHGNCISNFPEEDFAKYVIVLN